MFVISPLILIALALIFFMIFRSFQSEYVKKNCTKPNDQYIQIKSHSRQKYTIRYRKWTFEPPHKSNQSSISSSSSERQRTTFVIFISDIGDTLDIFDDLMAYSYNALLQNTQKQKNIIRFFAYDRIGIGMSSSYNSLCISPPKI